MITTKQELRACLDEEKSIYISSSCRTALIDRLVSSPGVQIWEYIKLLRKSEYHYNNAKQNPYHALMYLWCRRRKNRYGVRLGIEIDENTCDRGLRISHTGNIVVSGAAHLGKNCVLHGANCIGNTGLSGEYDAPMIGDNVDIGVGTSVIGDVRIANNVRIGAGAVVVKSCEVVGAVLVGVPAKVMNKD